MREVGHQTGSDRIGDVNDNDRDGGRRALDRLRGDRTCHDDHLDSAFNQVGGQRR
jgi:hypothetical protein